MLSYQERQELNKQGPFYIYHALGKKIGVSKNPRIRAGKAQKLQYEILEEVYDVVEVTDKEKTLQKLYGYKVDYKNYYDVLMEAQNVDHSFKKNNPKYSFKQGNTPEAIAKRAESKKKPIIQYDKQGNFIKEWDSTKSASIALNINSRAINSCLMRITKTAGRFIWKFK